VVDPKVVDAGLRDLSGLLSELGDLSPRHRECPVRRRIPTDQKAGGSSPPGRTKGRGGYGTNAFHDGAPGLPMVAPC
jgi:hypothetical protein